MSPEKLHELLKQVQDRSISVDEAVERLRHLPFEDLGFARVDHHRQIRCGFPEVIFCPSKTPEQVAAILTRLARTGSNVLATRASREVFEYVRQQVKPEGLRYEEAARIIVLEQKACEKSEGFVAIVTAGTADLPVAREAQVTAEMLGCRTKLICDVGVAGLHRLFEHLPDLHQADVVIVVAGMEGALASVIGGLMSGPVIAVPTSVGYGASFEGLAALLAMLNSCAAGVTVVNIDNGFGAAYAARQIQRKIEQAKRSEP
jgi:NCAIR mutase (PurE)-related protein